MTKPQITQQIVTQQIVTQELPTQEAIKKTIISPLPAQISKDKISRNALTVVDKINKAGFKAYLVGGCVRDMLLGLSPKDFDVATDANPDQVKKIFKNCRLIGRRFRLAHILFGREIIEVATFRGHHKQGSTSSNQEKVDYRNHKAHTKDGRIVRDNVYGSIEEDAVRRDFTVNALYLDMQNNQILDFVDGMKDLEQGVLRLIGDVETRYQEDPVRMLRSVRFSAKLKFAMEVETEAQIALLSHLLGGIPPARLFDEAVKLFQGGYGVQCFKKLQQYPLFSELFPSVSIYLKGKNGNQLESFIYQALKNTDLRISIGKSTNPAFFLSVLLWYPMLEVKQKLLPNCQSEIEATHKAAMDVLKKQQSHTSIPKRFSFTMKDIWFMQWYMQKPTKKQALKMLQHRRFRAAYDFLQLRVILGETQFEEAYNWWTEIQEKTEKEQHQMIDSLVQHKTSKHRKKKQT